jgi:hypothetical protein
MSHHSSNPSERPIISGTTTLTEPLEPYLPGNQPAGSLSGQTDTAPSHQQLGTGTGHLMAVPGGYISTSPTPLSKMGRKSADETTYPSIMTGGTGPEVMLGKWHLAESVNFDNYLKALGVNIVKRNMMSLEDYCVQFEKIGEETFKMTTSTTLKKIELTFKLDDKEIEEKTDDGRTVLTKMSWDNGTLTQKRFAENEGEKGGVVVRIFKGDEMELIAQVDDVICKRYYKRDPHCM